MVETTSTNDDAKSGAKAGRSARGDVGERVAERRAGEARSAQSGSLHAAKTSSSRCSSASPRPPARLPPLALVAGLAVRDAIARAAPERDVRIKWPNDVVVGDRGARRSRASSSKLILQGRARRGALVVGIGLNVHTRDFPPRPPRRTRHVDRPRVEPPRQTAPRSSPTSSPAFTATSSSAPRAVWATCTRASLGADRPRGRACRERWRRWKRRGDRRRDRPRRAARRQEGRRRPRKVVGGRGPARPAWRGLTAEVSSTCR